MLCEQLKVGDMCPVISSPGWRDATLDAVPLWPLLLLSSVLEINSLGGEITIFCGKKYTQQKKDLLRLSTDWANKVQG